ncbi:hypothetical protein AM592_10380 [Bacillus gobiensis]|uniref:Uncharacterized protein n=2 Tax=Bacillus TaxID=1386 RepID=A0A0M3R9T1_9BACI|nr:hypothetical protein AM592_10380 [Bacillus gobiensis]
MKLHSVGDILNKGRLRKMDLIMMFFFLLIGISSVLNILFKMTGKRDWLISLLLSAVLSIIYVAILR